MVAVGPIAGAVGVSLLAFGSFRLHAFLQGIRAYRERTKSETCVVPALHFLELLDNPIHRLEIGVFAQSGPSIWLADPTQV